MKLFLPVVYAAMLSGRFGSNSEGRCWAEDAQLEHPSIVQIERYMVFDASKTILLVLALIAMLGLCGCQFGDSNFRFTEEVQMSDGRVVKVNRMIAAKPLGEIGGPGGWEPKYMSFEIAAPQAPDYPPKWESSVGLLPILFDRDPDTGEWVLLATFYTCEPWYALGRPKLPYAEFRLRNEQWQRVELSEKWIGRPANVLTDISSDGEPEFINLVMKQTRMADRRIAPEYRSIVGRWATGC